MRIFTAVTSCLLLAISLEARAVMVEENLIVLEVAGVSPNEQLLVNKEETKVKKCKKNEHDGCIEVGQGNTARFEIKLKNGSDACRSAADKWGISKVLLGGEVAGTEPGSKPATWGALNLASADFPVDADTGEVTLQNNPNSSVEFSDSNSSAYTVWYTVVVEHCADGRTIQLDPSITNTGK